MRLCRVKGKVTGTIKDPGLQGVTLLLVTPVDDGDGSETIVADAVGAGVGELILVAEGSAARQAVALRGLPTDAAAVMIVDEVQKAK
ncbi:MAG: EutN/CcmL family microcompartment protein [Actinomycetia bacterium]|nr:EutN/CcmL family microcompartment protein [Actinomycetes bacterium]